MIQKTVTSGRKRRSPKTGVGFSLLRFVGISLQIIGVLSSTVSCIGFLIILVRITPELISIMQSPESQMAGFVLILDLVWLFAPLIFVLLGAISFGLGFALYRTATQAVPNVPE